MKYQVLSTILHSYGVHANLLLQPENTVTFLLNSNHNTGHRQMTRSSIFHDRLLNKQQARRPQIRFPDLNQQCSHLNSLAATIELTNPLLEGSTSLSSDEWYFTYVYSWTKRCLVILLRSYTWSIPWRRSSHIWSRLIGRRPCWWELAGLYVAIVCFKNVKCGREAPTPHLHSSRILSAVSQTATVTLYMHAKTASTAVSMTKTMQNDTWYSQKFPWLKTNHITSQRNICAIHVSTKETRWHGTRLTDCDS